MGAMKMLTFQVSSEVVGVYKEQAHNHLLHTAIRNRVQTADN